MIEIELFYKIVESEIRRKHIKYLKKQKCLPSDRTEPPADEETNTVSDEFVYTDEPTKKEQIKRVKAFNKGIETALKVLISKYKSFNNRLNKEEEVKKKF